MPSQPKKYTRLTNAQKLRLCRVAELKQPCTLQALSEWATRAYDLPTLLPQSTVHDILRRRAALTAMCEATQARKKLADPVMDQFEASLVAEFDKMEAEIKTVTDEALLTLARHWADLRSLPSDKRPGFSKGWLHRFKSRHGIKSRRKQGEAASVDPEIVRLGRPAMRKFTDQYALRDVFNMDETSFYYQMEAPRTLSRRKHVSGYKSNKTRLTMAVACNADGSEKLPLLFIGKAQCPRDLKGRDMSELGVEYTNSKKAWMNSAVFLRWLHTLDMRMQREKRHILLLVDNVSSHVRPLKLLTNVRLEYLPANTTSVLQPLDQGIILCIKRGFQHRKVNNSVQRYLQGLPQERIGVFTALRWAKMAWDSVQPDTIRNCWAHAGISAVPWKSAISHILI